MPGDRIAVPRYALAVTDLDALRVRLETDPGVVVDEITRHLPGLDDPRQAALLLALLGRARLALGEVDLAEAALDDALARAGAAGAADALADAHLAWASVRSFAGRFDDALAHVAEVERLGSPTLVAHARLQRAAVAQRTGRIDLALDHYRSALPLLRASRADLDVARVLANCGVIDVQRGLLGQGIDELREAHELFAAAGHEFAAAQMTHNVGWALGRRGDLPAALAHFDEAKAAFDRLGYAADEATFDRAEVLLAAGLAEDALAAGTEAAERLGAAGNESGTAEAWLLCAHAARMLGDTALAAHRAEQAERLFRRLDHVAWADVARLEGLWARARGSDLGTAEQHELATLRDRLEAAGVATGAVAAAALGAVTAARAGDHDAADRFAASCGRLARRTRTVEAQTLAALARAEAAAARGDGAAARAQVRRGVDLLVRHQAVLNATEARTHITAYGAELAALGLRLALTDGRPSRVLAAMEQLRASVLRHPPARPPADDALAGLLAELRSVSAGVRAAESEGADAAGLRAEQRRLEAEVRAAWLRSTGPAGHDGRARAGRLSPPTMADLRRLVGDGTLLALAVSDHRLYGVRVTGRSAHTIALGDAGAIGAAGMAAADALHALARPGRTRAIRRARADALGRAVDVLDRAVGGLARRGGAVTLVVPAAWTSFPWPLLPSWRGRAVSVAPSAWWWGRPGHRSPATSVLVAAGPRLVHGDDEARRVAAVHPHARLLVGAEATAAAVLDGFDRADVAHVVAHGHFRHDNPTWSSLELADGPLVVHDLERLDRTPGLVVLSTCETAAPGAHAGDEVLGVMAALLARGTRTVVASAGPLPDEPATAATMVELHEHLRAGRRPAEVLAGLLAAELDALRADVDTVLSAACFTCFGEG